MSYPSFHSYIRTLRSLLKRKQRWLLEESTFLADLCLAYGSIAGLSDRQKRTLFLAAHFKNLGALYLDDHCLHQGFEDHKQALKEMQGLFTESAQMAREAGLKDVAVVLEQYYQRAIPEDYLARVFQVINAWVSCRQRKGWRSSIGDKEALVILRQRAEMGWSDPKIVVHFIEHLCRYSSRPELIEACSLSGFETVDSTSRSDVAEFDPWQPEQWSLSAALESDSY
jgi:response regulator RpfG family c-di-GMP phosphodiesterase